MAESAWYSWAAGVPVTILEIDQASTALAGQADMGAVTLASPTANPGAISATVLSENGNLNGAYQYVMTETMGAIDGHGNLHPAGQTAAGTASNVVNASNNPVSLALPAPSALAISRTIWRTTGGGSTFYFLVTIVDPQVSAWTDNVADADLGSTEAPTVNTTGTLLQLPVYNSVPAFSAAPGVMIAVTDATSGQTNLYRSQGSGWANVSALLNGTTLNGGATGLSLNLANANTWTGAQGFTGGWSLGTSGTTGYVTADPTASNPWIGLYDSSNNLYYGIFAGLPAPSGVTGIGGYYAGVGVGGSTNGTGTPLFGVLTSTQSSQGVGHTAFGVTDTNVVTTYNNTLDDGAGAATISGLLTANGNIALPSVTPETTAGVLSQSGNQLYMGNGSGAVPVGSNPLVAPLTYAALW